MKQYNGGSKVEGAYYFNTTKWSIVGVSGDEGTLAGDPSDRFIRTPFLLTVPLALLLSFAYVMFLPFAGFILTGQAIYQKVRSVSSAALEETLAAVTPGMAPGAAYLTGHENDDAAKKAEADTADPMTALKREIAAKRAAETAPEKKA